MVHCHNGISLGIKTTCHLQSVKPKLNDNANIIKIVFCKCMNFGWFRAKLLDVVIFIRVWIWVRLRNHFYGMIGWSKVLETLELNIWYFNLHYFIINFEWNIFIQSIMLFSGYEDTNSLQKTLSYTRHIITDYLSMNLQDGGDTIHVSCHH